MAEQKLTRNQIQGRPAEMLFALEALPIIFPKNKGYRIEYNDFDNYAQEVGGLDIEVYHKRKLLYVFEVKNWTWFVCPYGTDRLRENTFERFSGLGNVIKILLISYLSLLTYGFKDLLKQHDIHGFEFTKVITEEDLHNTGFITYIANRLKQFIDSVRKGIRLFGNTTVINTVNNYLTTNNTIINKVNNYLINNNKYDRGNSGLVKGNWLDRVRKQKKLEKLRELKRRFPHLSRFSETWIV